jgi:GPH family glycoside/pentoside/hexuronide:cation symporter
MVAGLACVALVRERYYGKLVVAGKQDKISIKETLWQTLQCKPFQAQVCMNLAYNLGTSMVGTLGFAATMYYVCGGRLTEGNGWNFLMGLAGLVFGLTGIRVFGFIASRVGKKLTMGVVFSVAILIFISTWWLYDPTLRWLQLLACGLIAFTGAGFWVLFYSLLADVVDYDELQTGRRREGAFSACVSWISKVGMAGGAGCSFFILQWIGFDAKLGGNQTEHTLFMIRILLATIPVIGLTIALFALARYPLTQEKMAEIRQQLEARRGKV